MTPLQQFDRAIAEAFEHVETLALAGHPDIEARLRAVGEVCAAWADAIRERSRPDAAANGGEP